MKGRRVLVTFIAACAAVCIMTPSVAQAANTTCPNAWMLSLGERGQDFVAASTSVYYKVSVVAGRSYSIMAWAPFQDPATSLVSIDTNFFTDNACTVAAATVDSTDREPNLNTTSHDGDVDSIIPNFTGTLCIRTANLVATGYYIHTMVVETSLFSPWWFTGGTNQAYVELRNNMANATNGPLTFYAPTGAVCGTSNFSLDANGNTAVLIDGVGTCVGFIFGSAQLVFQGTPGGMTANITTIDVRTAPRSTRRSRHAWFGVIRLGDVTRWYRQA